MKRLVPSYDRFSHNARRALAHAGSVVTRLRHPYADTGHLLVGVMLTQESLGFQVLTALQFDAEQAESYLLTLSPSLDHSPDDIQNTDDLNTALSLAADESAWFGHHYIGTEHLLLGITRTNVGNASYLLRHLGISPEAIRRRVRNILNDGARELDLQSAKRNARLSELSRRVINAAEQLAVALDHPTVGLGHLLLVMLREERSPISALLWENGMDETRLRQGLDANDPLLMVSIETLLNRALDYAQSVGSHYTGTDHLLLTLVSEEAGHSLFHAYGLNATSIRRSIQEQNQQKDEKRTGGLA